MVDQEIVDGLKEVMVTLNFIISLLKKEKSTPTTKEEDKKNMAFVIAMRFSELKFKYSGRPIYSASALAKKMGLEENVKTYRAVGLFLREEVGLEPYRSNGAAVYWMNPAPVERWKERYAANNTI